MNRISKCFSIEQSFLLFNLANLTQVHLKKKVPQYCSKQSYSTTAFPWIFKEFQPQRNTDRLGDPDLIKRLR